MGRPKGSCKRSRGKNSVDVADTDSTSNDSWGLPEVWQLQGKAPDEWLLDLGSLDGEFSYGQFPVNPEMPRLAGAQHLPILMADEDTRVTGITTATLSVNPMNTKGCTIDFQTLTAIHLDIDRLCPQTKSSGKQANFEGFLSRVDNLCAITRNILAFAREDRDQKPAPPCLDEPVLFLVFTTMLKVVNSYQAHVDTCTGRPFRDRAMSSGAVTPSLTWGSSSGEQTTTSPFVGSRSGAMSPLEDMPNRRINARTPETMMHLLSIDLDEVQHLNRIDFHLLHFMHLVLLFDFEPTRQEANVMASVRGSKGRITALHKQLRSFLISASIAWELHDSQDES